jgi:hypothetical protein
MTADARFAREDGTTMRDPQSRVPVRTIAATIGMVLFTAAILLLGWEVRRVLTWIVVAALLAIILGPLVDMTERRLHLRRRWPPCWCSWSPWSRWPGSSPYSSGRWPTKAPSSSTGSPRASAKSRFVLICPMPHVVARRHATALVRAGARLQRQVCSGVWWQTATLPGPWSDRPTRIAGPPRWIHPPCRRGNLHAAATV